MLKAVADTICTGVQQWRNETWHRLVSGTWGRTQGLQTSSHGSWTSSFPQVSRGHHWGLTWSQNVTQPSCAAGTHTCPGKTGWRRPMKGRKSNTSSWLKLAERVDGGGQWKWAAGGFLVRSVYRALKLLGINKEEPPEHQQGFGLNLKVAVDREGRCMELLLGHKLQPDHP